MRRRGAVGLLALAVLVSACTPAAPELGTVVELPPYVVDGELPDREELVADVSELLADVADEAEPASRTARVVDALHGEIALEHARHLSTAHPVRTPFSIAERETAEWIAAELHAIGFPEEDVHLHTFATKALSGYARAELDRVRELAPQERSPLSQNVVARLHGAGDGVVVVGAHYDTAGFGLGDNGTGVGLLLETAWRLQGQELPHSVEFVFFGAEHAAFAGAQVHVEALRPERESLVLMVNASGLADGDILGFDAGLLDAEVGLPTTDELTRSIRDTAEALDLGLRPFHQGIFAPGANLAFTYAGARVLNLSAVTNRILERPSLEGGAFRPGDVVPLAEAEEPVARIIVDETETTTPAFRVDIDGVRGRMARSLYVYATLLETLLLAFPS